MIEAVLLDVDGTLVDNNLLHVLAWQRAFLRLGKQVPSAEILHMVGMGGDRLAPAILGEDQRATERARELHAEEYVGKKLIDHSEALPGASSLLAALRARRVRIALASSAKAEELERYLKLLGGQDIADVRITQENVATTKPAPDIFACALEALGGPARALVVGDTVYDVEAARKLGLPCIAVLTGGIEREVLAEAGARAIYESAADIEAHLDEVLRIEG